MEPLRPQTNDASSTAPRRPAMAAADPIAESIGAPVKIPTIAPASMTPATSADNDATRAPTQLASAPRTSFSPTKPPYMPQFTAATQMILKRMRGESTSLSSTLASTAATDRTPISASTYEDVKRRLLTSMHTSSNMTLQMPALTTSTSSSGMGSAASVTMAMPMPAASVPRPAGRMSAIQKVNAGLTASGRPTPSAAAKRASAEAKQSSAGTNSKRIRLSGSSRVSGGKRRRGKGGDAEETSSLSSLSDEELDDTNTATTTPTTTTKSGRQVLKPTTYNPSAMDSATKKRAHYGKRTPGEAMCKLCTRLAFTDANQIVFCDGCEGAWHQRCHEPHIEPEVINDPNAKWFCSACLVKKERHSANKKIKVEPLPVQPPPPKFVAWADRTAGQKRAYLNGISQAALVDMVMHALELQPNLAIFPNPESSAPVITSTARSLFAASTTDGLFARAEANPNGPINFIRKASGAVQNGSGGIFLGSSMYRDVGLKVEDEEKLTGYTPFDPEEEDPYGLKRSWLKPGKGPHDRILFGGDDLLVDQDDYEAFSHVIYNLNGRKVEENGMAV